MLHLTYAASLRVSEVTGLLCTELDGARDTSSFAETVVARGGYHYGSRFGPYFETGWRSGRPVLARICSSTEFLRTPEEIGTHEPAHGDLPNGQDAADRMQDGQELQSEHVGGW